jgi:hypothetical protein
VSDAIISTYCVPFSKWCDRSYLLHRYELLSHPTHFRCNNDHLLHQILKIDAIAATYCIIFVFDARGRDAIGSKFSSVIDEYLDLGYPDALSIIASYTTQFMPRWVPPCPTRKGHNLIYEAHSPARRSQAQQPGAPLPGSSYSRNMTPWNLELA